MIRKRISAVLISLIVFLLPMTAFAQDFDAGRTGSISVTLKDQDGTTPISGVEFSVYHVATVALNNDNNLSYTFTGEFRDCGYALDDPSLPEKLDAFVKEHSVAHKKLVTDGEGAVTFTDLPLGLYFLQQTNMIADYAVCTSFLVTVPNPTTDGYVYDVNASPKTDIAKLTDITIKKVWNTGKTGVATNSVTVQLLKNGAVVETAILNAQNNWQITYTDMPESDGYTILEATVPKGFTATYSNSGYVFTVTNTASLAQTGQLIWPIPVLAFAGLCLIAVGTIVLRKTENQNA